MGEGAARKGPRTLGLAAGLKQPRILCQELGSSLASQEGWILGQDGPGDQPNSPIRVTVSSLQDEASGSESLPSFPTVPGSHLFLLLHSPQGVTHCPACCGRESATTSSGSPARALERRSPTPGSPLGAGVAAEAPEPHELLRGTSQKHSPVCRQWLPAEGQWPAEAEEQGHPTPPPCCAPSFPLSPEASQVSVPGRSAGTSQHADHRIQNSSAWKRPLELIWFHPAPAGSPGACCSRLWTDGSWISPGKEPQEPLWAAWASAEELPWKFFLVLMV